MALVDERVRGMYNQHIFPKRNAYGVQKIHEDIVHIFQVLGIQMEDLRGKTLLDAGCGTGELSCFLASYGAIVTGIDFSDGSLEYGRSLVQRMELSNATFIKGSLLEYNFPENAYDFVLSHMVLHHTSDPARAFSNIVRALKPGGSVIFRVFDFWGTMGPFQKSPLWKLWVVRWLAGDDVEKRVRIGERLFYRPGHEAQHGLEKNQYLYDLFGVPQVSYHRWGELLGWIKRNHLAYHSSNPPMEFSKLVAPYLSKTETNRTVRGRIFLSCGKLFLRLAPIHQSGWAKRPSVGSRLLGQLLSFISAGSNMITIRAVKLVI